MHDTDQDDSNLSNLSETSFIQNMEALDYIIGNDLPMSSVQHDDSMCDEIECFSKHDTPKIYICGPLEDESQETQNAQTTMEELKIPSQGLNHSMVQQLDRMQDGGSTSKITLQI